MTVRPFTIEPSRDPLRWCAGLTAVFLIIVLHRLGLPSKPMFDEIHYLPAARNMLALSSRLNPEHPLLGKEMIATGMGLVGDNAWGWRLPSALLGTLGLFAAMRALWWASLSRQATLLFGVFLATDFVWFMISRIAMLDMAMAAMLAVAFWQWALAWRIGADRPARARLHLALAGVFLGLSLSAKWNGIPLVVTPGLLFAAQRWIALKGRRAQLLTARDAGPVPGVSLLEAAFWLGSVPLLVYFASFAPMFFYKVQPMTLGGMLEFQRYMLQLQDSVVKPHHYMSQWWQWVFNLRPIWFFYEQSDGAQRGVLMLGNPFSMLAALPAVLLCLWDGIRRNGSLWQLRGGVALFYALSLVFWALNGKPVQFYYHYMLASTFAMAALALVLGEWWDLAIRWPGKIALAMSVGMFVWFYPIISAAILHDGRNSFETYTWLDSWR
ncbi:phospholipid carrier-dependent glycosyltransferase [Novosphingobium lentum]|uniref:phospholipid carrier-dependent glycosyltransferase n=1 Tax=Novosphingobium lentum TaxID=145287 RepID=UPI000832F92B|nr:phospholipid carrier-dependent glycosyltransferase [Novosphingobium lentum]